MTVKEMINMFVEPKTQQFKIYSDCVGWIIFTGTLDTLNDELADKEITSVDNLCDNYNYNCITINVN